MNSDDPIARPAARKSWLHGPMRVLFGAAVIVAFAFAFLMAGLYFLVPDDQALARRAEISLEKSLGVPVTLGALRWRLLPSPALLVEDAATVQPQPIRIQRLLLRPDLPALLARRVMLKRIELHGATVPQLSLAGLGAQTAEDDNGIWRIEPTPPARFFFRDLTWVSRRGLALAYDGEIDFDPDWRPHIADVRRPGVQPAADLRLVRQETQVDADGQDSWSVRMNLGGGVSEGKLRLKSQASRMRLDGTLQSTGVDVAALMQTFGLEPVVAGKANGPTALRAEGDAAAGLARSLHTQTRLQIAEARLLRFNVDRAVKSAGTDYGGQTPLDSLSLQLDTQNTANGMVIDYSSVKARSGVLVASGRGRLSASRQVSAEFEIDLVDGIVGVPLVLSGPVDKLNVSVPKSAVAGAAVGTAVLPGVGTALGARLGARAGKLFERQPAPPGETRPAVRPGDARVRPPENAQFSPRDQVPDKAPDRTADRSPDRTPEKRPEKRPDRAADKPASRTPALPPYEGPAR
jgi:AsmA-like C-terminal region